MDPHLITEGRKFPKQLVGPLPACFAPVFITIRGPQAHRDSQDWPHGILYCFLPGFFLTVTASTDRLRTHH